MPAETGYCVCDIDTYHMVSMICCVSSTFHPPWSPLEERPPAVVRSKEREGAVDMCPAYESRGCTSQPMRWEYISSTSMGSDAKPICLCSPHQLLDGMV